MKKLQEAMYHSTENGNIEMTLDLRNFGVPWTIHSWIRTLLTAQQGGLTNILDELLQVTLLLLIFIIIPVSHAIIIIRLFKTALAFALIIIVISDNPLDPYLGFMTQSSPGFLQGVDGGQFLLLH